MAAQEGQNKSHVGMTRQHFRGNEPKDRRSPSGRKCATCPCTCELTCYRNYHPNHPSLIHVGYVRARCSWCINPYPNPNPFTEEGARLLLYEADSSSIRYPADNTQGGRSHIFSALWMATRSTKRRIVCTITPSVHGPNLKSSCTLSHR